jgi:hypothetical protein
MKTVTITKNVYCFDELSEDAKQAVLDNFRNDHFLLAWQDENEETVKAIANKFGWTYSAYSYDGVSYSVEYDMDDEDAALLSGKRAMAYIWNNFVSVAMQPKTYWLNNVLYCDGRKNWTRKSKINFTIDDCPFTGYCMDCCFSEAWRDWKKTFSTKSTVQDFLDSVADRLSKDWTSDNEYQLSDDGIKELIDANDYEFLEDGKLF